MIEKITGRVAYDVVRRVYGTSAEEHAVPWNKLTYDTRLGGYRTDITENQVRVRQRSPAIRSATGATGAANVSFVITIGCHTTGTSVLPRASRKPSMRKRYNGGKPCLGNASPRLHSRAQWQLQPPRRVWLKVCTFNGPGFGVDRPRDWPS
jgi:hypothetical protein